MAAGQLVHSKRNSDRDSWLIAWALTLALYAAAILIFRGLAPPTPSIAIHRFEPVRLVFKSPGPEKRRAEERRSEPQFFSELPPNRADVAPKQPEFLSNVTSRARQPVPGADGALPRMQGEIDAPLVKLENNGGPSRPPEPPVPPRPSEPAASSRAASAQPPNLAAQGQAAAAGARSTSPAADRPDSARAPTDAASHAIAGSGNSDFDQPQMDNPNGSASLTGDVSLNTMAWDYAPWLERFGRKLMQHWFPPPAYSLGILKEGGWTIVEAEISRSGELLRLERLEQRGHPALAVAAESAIRSMAPFERLPADFPEPTLTLRIRMIYPKIHPR